MDNGWIFCGLDFSVLQLMSTKVFVALAKFASPKNAKPFIPGLYFLWFQTLFQGSEKRFTGWGDIYLSPPPPHHREPLGLELRIPKIPAIPPGNFYP